MGGRSGVAIHLLIRHLQEHRVVLQQEAQPRDVLTHCSVGPCLWRSFSGPPKASLLLPAIEGPSLSAPVPLEKGETSRKGQEESPVTSCIASSHLRNLGLKGKTLV